MKYSNYTPKLNIYKYTNYNIIEIYINRSSNTKQIFIAMYYSIMSEKQFHFWKKTKAFGKDIFFPPCRRNWIHELWKNFFESCVPPISQRYIQKLERKWNNSGCIKVDNFWKSVNFQASQQSVLIKNVKQRNLEYSFWCEKLKFGAKHIIIHIFWKTLLKS